MKIALLGSDNPIPEAVASVVQGVQIELLVYKAAPHRGFGRPLYGPRCKRQYDNAVLSGVLKRSGLDCLKMEVVQSSRLQFWLARSFFATLSRQFGKLSLGDLLGLEPPLWKLQTREVYP